MTTAIVDPLSSQIVHGGVPQKVLPPLLVRGSIYNPITAADQGISAPETLYVSQAGPASRFASDNTLALAPGQRYDVVPDSYTYTWVSAATAGHKFSAFGELPVPSPDPPTPVPTTFPPAGYTTQTKLIGSYLYKQYDDDDDLQAFVDSYNNIGQEFIDTINQLNLPIYTQDQIAGNLLDWVALGLYGMVRPALLSGQTHVLGPLNTYAFNSVPALNTIKAIGPSIITVTTDDIFKRVLTWAFLKGDGPVFSVRWLKRRVMRFLMGKNGTNPNIDQTYQISMTFGANNEVAIRFIDYTTEVTGSAVMNGFAMNTAMFNECNVSTTPLEPLPFRDVFQEAVGSGALELPFQFTYDVIL